VLGTQESPEAFAERAYAQVRTLLDESHAVILHERLFGDLAAAPSVLATRARVLAPLGNRAAVPPTYVEGRPGRGSGMAGLHLITARPSAEGESRLIERDGMNVGRVVTGREARFVALSDVGRLVRSASTSTPSDEVQRTLTTTDTLLRELGCSFKDVRRTWYYLDRILDWYGDFNRVRNGVFQHLGLLNGGSPTLIPASTGILGRNAAGGACALDVLASTPLDGHRFGVRRLLNTKQNEATEYGSAFSRGLELTLDSARYVFVSGTASIDEQGRTIFAGDFEAQTACTLEMIAALIAPIGARLSDLCQATAFFKSPEHVEVFPRIARRFGMEEVPTVNVIADVCRDDLLFELDATAVLR
jgi:enamine deaminase RidA (YjgF/YER057c/UK114 family)